MWVLHTIFNNQNVVYYIYWQMHISHLILINDLIIVINIDSESIGRNNGSKFNGTLFVLKTFKWKNAFGFLRKPFPLFSNTLSEMDELPCGFKWMEVPYIYFVR